MQITIYTFIKKRSNTFTKLLKFGKRQLILNTLITLFLFSQYSFAQTSICPTDCQEFCIEGNNFPLGGTIDFYYDTNAAFDPFNGEGTLMGSATIEANNVATPTNTTNSDASCPSILGIMVDACNGTGTESDNEFLLLINGNTNLAVSNLDIDLPNNTNINTVTGFVPGATVTTTLTNAGVTGPCLTTIDGTSTIPANAFVVVFTASDLSMNYDFTDLCNSVGTIYVLMKDQTPATGSFSNTGGRTTVLNVFGCTATSYSYDGATTGDGAFFQFSAPDPIFTPAGNNGGTPASGSTFLSPLSCAAPPVDVTNNDDPVCFQYTFDSSFCNLGGNAGFFIKAITNPLATSCSQNDATSTTFNYSMSCPEAVLSVTGDDNPECALGNIQTFITFDTEGTYDFTITNGTTTTPFDGIVVNAGNVNTPISLTTTATAGDYFFSIVSIFLDVDDDDAPDSGCNISFSGTSSATIYPTPTANYIIGEPTCAGEALFTITPSGGTPPYTVTYTDPNGNTQTAEGGPNAFSIEATISGNYSLVSITDDNALCSSFFQEFTIVELSSPPTLNTPPTSSLCGNGTTSIDLTSLNSNIFSGSATFDWLGIDAGTAAGQEQNYTPADGQTLRVEVIPTNGCPAYQDVTFNALSCCNLAPNLSSNSPICVGDDLTLTATVANGSPDYVYQWSGGIATSTTSSSTANATINNANNSNAGIYTVTITDGNNCMATATTQVIVNDLPTASVQGATVCLNEPVTLSLSTDATAGASYQWSGGSTSATQVVNTDIAGTQTFTVTVTNANDCSSTATAQVIVNDLPTASVQGSTVCLNDPVTLSVSTNATTGATYEWSGGSSMATQTVNTANAGTQTFTVTVTNSNDCSSTATAQVIVNDLPTASVEGSTVCLNEPVTLSVSTDATTGASYQWSGGSTAAMQVVNTDIAGTQTFTVTVTNANDCTNTATAQVIVNDLPTASIQGSTVCLNDPVTLSLSTNATTGATYEWSGGSSMATQTVDTSNSGTQTFTVTVTNANDCTNTATAQVIVNDLPTASVQGSTVCLNEPVTLSVSTDATTGATYEWSGGSSMATQTVNTANAGTQTFTVTVTNSNDCTNTATAQVIVNDLPTASVQGSTVCLNDPVTLSVSTDAATGATYQWSSGSTSAMQVVNTDIAGTQTFTVTVTNANDCTNTATAQVIVNDLPTASVQGSTVCLNEPVTLSLSTNATTGATYSWSGGSTSATQVVNTDIAGTQTFTVTVTNANDCTNTAIAQVIVNDLPTASVQGATVCLNEPVTLSLSTDATAGASYQWSGGSTSATQVVNTDIAGTQTFTVTVTNSNDCTNTATAQVIVNDLPTASIQGSTVCLNEPVTLSVSTNATTGATYEWSGGSSMTTQTVNTANAGTQTFTVTVTNSNDCTNTATAQVIVNDLPTVSVQGSTVCLNESVTLSVSTDATTGATYEWSGGSTAATQTVDTSNAGTQTFIVTVTNANDCSSTATVQVIVNDLPTASVQGSTVCLNAPVTLSVSTDATMSASYQWSGGSTSATQVVNTDIAGTQTFTVTVTNSDNCSTTAIAQVVVNDLPTASVQGSTVCLNEPITLSVSTDATIGATYEWSGGSTSATQEVNTDIAGTQTFTVTVTNANDCTNTATAQVIVNDLPTASVQGSTVCLNEPVTLSVSTDATTGASYQWSGGSTSAMQVVNTDIAGTQTFTVTVTNSNDCTDAATAQVIVNDLPTASVQGETVCLNDPVTLSVSTDGTIGATYSWSGGSSAATQTVNTANAGTQTFTVTVTNSNDCTNTATAQVIVNDLPTASVQGETVCLNEPITLSVSTDATTGATYAWSGGSTSVTQVVNTDIAGTQTFTVTVTNSDNCSSTAVAQVIVNDLPTASVQGETVCLNEPVTLSVSTNATTGVSYQWSGGSTSAMQVVNTDITGTQTFTVTVTNSDNCSSTTVAQVIVNDLPTISVQGETVCLNEPVTLSVSTNATTGAIYQWSGGSTSATQVVNTDIAGTQTFTVTVTNANDCTNTATAEVVVNDLPTASIQGSTVCLNEPVTLSVSPNVTTGASYQWSGGSTAATQVVNTDIAGTQTFTVTVTNANNCTNTATAQVIVNDLPIASVQGSTVCLNDPVTLSVSTDMTTGATYQWSGGSNSAMQVVNTDIAGTQTFTVTVTNANDCTNTATAQVIVNDLPTASVQGETVCLNEPVTLSVSTNATTGATYAWSGGSTSATQVVNTDIAGTQTFTVTVTNSDNCSSTTVAQVIVNDLPTISVQGETVCLNEPVTLSVSTNATTGAIYQWSGGSTSATQEVNTDIAGTQTFTVTVTNSDNCSSTAVAQVIVNDLPTASVQGSTVCLNEPVTLSLSTNATTGATYQWSGGSSMATQMVNTSNAGTQTFTVTVTNSNNCTNTVTAQVIVNDLPTASVQGETVCLNEPVTLSVSTDATTGASYQWSGGSTSAMQVVNTDIAGTQTFTVTVTNSDNCSTTATAQVVVNELSMVTLDNQVVCEGETAILEVGSGFESYVWSNGAMGQSIEVGEGNYEVEVRDANGCTAVAQASVVEITPPAAEVQSIVSVCNDTNEGTTLLVLMNLVLSGDTNGTWRDGSGNVVTFFDGSGRSTGAYGFTYTLPSDGICPSVTYSVTIGVQNCEIVCAELDGTQAVLESEICSGDGLELMDGAIVQNDFVGGIVEWVFGDSPDFNAYSTDAELFTGALPTNENCEVATYYLKARLGGIAACLDESAAFEVEVYPDVAALTEASSEENCTVEVTTCSDFVVSYEGGSFEGSGAIALEEGDESPMTISVVNPNAPAALECGEVVLSQEFECVANCCSFVPPAKADFQVCSGDDVDLEVALEGNCPNIVQWSNGASGTIINTGALINDTCEPIEVVFTALITTTDNCPQQTQTFTIDVLPVPSANNVEVNTEDCRIELNTCDTFEVSYRVNGGAAQSGNTYIVAEGEMADVEFLVESVACGIFEVAEMVDCSEVCPMIEAVEANVSICSGQVAELAVAVSNVSGEEVRWSNGAVGGMIEVEGLVNTGCEPIVEVFTAQIAAMDACEAVSVDIEVTVFPEPESQVNVEILEDNCTVVASACEGVGILYRLSDGSLVASDTYVAEAGSGINTVEFLFTSPYSCGNTTINATINCVENGAIGNFVWYDLNENGLQDLGEPGIAGVFVHLYAVDGTLLATERTDGNGYYLFDDLPAGTYYVVFDLPNAYEVTQSNVGMNDGIDSDANPTTGQTDSINLGQGEVNLTIDAGLVGTTIGSISNFVWLDVNGNSVQDEGEPGVANVVINLLDENGNVIETTVTDENGFYAFTNLPSGTYQIEVIGDLNFVPENEGENDDIDSDIGALDGLSDIIVLDEGENDVTIDVGIRPSECGTIAGIFGSIGDCLITNGVLSILTNEVTLGLGQQLVYVLYTDENDVMGSIIDQNGTPFFEIDTNENPTLFVAAISGFDLDGDGLPDADAVCFNIEEGPTVQAQILNLEVQFQCASDNLTYDLGIQIFDNVEGRYDIEVNGELIEDVPANQLFEYGDFQNGEPYMVQIIEADTDCVLATVSGIGDCIKLPVSLLEFNGEVLKEGNQLQWVTASELNNDYFNLHYSTDGVNFEVVAAIEGNGTTSEASSYSFLHREAANGTVYYYLSQTDFDGTNGRISNTISLQRGEAAFELIEVLPIPSSDFVHVRFHAPQGAADAQMALYDVLGRNVWNAQYEAVMGFNDLEVDVRGLAVGVYVLSLEVNGEQRQVKIVVD